MEEKITGVCSFGPQEQWPKAEKRKKRAKKVAVAAVVGPAKPPANASAIDKEFEEWFGVDIKPLRPSRGKPNKEQLARLQEFSQKKKQFVAHYKGHEKTYAEQLVKKRL